MTTETLLLVGREDGNAREVFETHAERLADRAAVDRVEVATYESEPHRELGDRLRSLTADRVYAVPMCAAHTRDTLDAVPRALSVVPGDVYYCDPPGESPAVTDVLAERARALRSGDEDVSLVLVGFGSSSNRHHRRTGGYHAGRLRRRSEYDEVVTCYLVQNPTVECVRYNVSNPETVAVPLFVARSEATEQRIPAALELDRGGVEYAAPLETHPRLTDAIHAAVARRRTLADAGTGADAGLTTTPPVATDGEGGRR